MMKYIGCINNQVIFNYLSFLEIFFGLITKHIETLFVKKLWKGTS